ncbi:MAG: putative quinol monooxygenase [Gammaproteobacteria bacterium]
MITVLFYCTGKPGQEAPLRELLARMQRVSRDEDRAVAYTFMQEKENPARWALFEQWRDQEHLGAHVVNMKKHFGDPPAGARLPAQLHALVERSDYTFYQAL